MERTCASTSAPWLSRKATVWEQLTFLECFFIATCSGVPVRMSISTCDCNEVIFLNCTKIQILSNICDEKKSIHTPPHLQMKPTRCTLLLSIFISTSLHVLSNYVPIIRTYCIYVTLVFFTVYGWLSGLLQQARQPPVQSEKYQCRIDTVSSPDDGHIVA